MIREALFYDRDDDHGVRCRLCAHRCRIEPGRPGICGVRENRQGVLYSLVYGTVIAENVDPIEKKPFFHVLPGSKSYSFATPGCNFQCDFCQNAEISQVPRTTRMIMGDDALPMDIVTRAQKSGCRSIAYTYTEPTVFMEFAYDTAMLARSAGLLNVFVTNGYMTPEVLEWLAPCLNAANVDLKSFSDDFYRKHCGARLDPVLHTLRVMKNLGIWVEITTLLIPGLNDSREELEKIAVFIASLGTETPWHISRFHPQYRMRDRPVTPVDSLHMAVRIGTNAGLKYVYSGNARGDEGENTRCSGCKKLLIQRYGYQIRDLSLNGQACPDCQTPIDGIFETAT